MRSIHRLTGAKVHIFFYSSNKKRKKMCHPFIFFRFILKKDVLWLPSSAKTPVKRQKIKRQNRETTLVIPRFPFIRTSSCGTIELIFLIIQLCQLSTINSWQAKRAKDTISQLVNLQIHRLRVEARRCPGRCWSWCYHQCSHHWCFHPHYPPPLQGQQRSRASPRCHCGRSR